MRRILACCSHSSAPQTRKTTMTSFVQAARIGHRATRRGDALMRPADHPAVSPALRFGPEGASPRTTAGASTTDITVARGCCRGCCGSIHNRDRAARGSGLARRFPDLQSQSMEMEVSALHTPGDVPLRNRPTRVRVTASVPGASPGPSSRNVAGRVGPQHTVRGWESAAESSCRSNLPRCVASRVGDAPA